MEYGFHRGWVRQFFWQMQWGIRSDIGSMFPHVGKSTREPWCTFDGLPECLPFAGKPWVRGGCLHQSGQTLKSSQLPAPFGVGKLLTHVGNLDLTFTGRLIRGDGMFTLGGGHSCTSTLMLFQ